MRTPHPPGVVLGGALPRTRLCKPGPQHNASGPARVRPSVPRRDSGGALSVRKGPAVEKRDAERGAEHRDLRAAPLTAPTFYSASPADPAARPRPDPQCCVAAQPLPQVAAGVVLVVVLGLRVPEQHGWSSKPANDPGVQNPTQAAWTLQGHLEARSESPRDPPAPLWTAQGAGPRPDPPLKLSGGEVAPGRPPHLADPRRHTLPGSKQVLGAPDWRGRHGRRLRPGPRSPPRGWGLR